jgi:DNA replication protein DnaC
MSTGKAKSPRPAHLVELPLATPNRRLLRQVERSWSRVATELQEFFRQLATGERPWPALLHGPTGTGKSIGALCFCDRIRSAFFDSLEGLCDITMSRDENNKEDCWEKVRTKDLVVIDEIGARERIGDLQYSTLKKVLDIREMHAKRVGLYITNCSPDVLPVMFDDRVASRMLCGSIFELNGEDRR